ncbi:MAG: hypothetical protein AAF587_41000 [Bacteroidota bacterium]
MKIIKEYIKGLSRQFRLVLMAWLVESFQEEEADSPDTLVFSDELTAHIDAIDAKIKSGEMKTRPWREVRKKMEA